MSGCNGPARRALLAAAGIDRHEVAVELAESFSEVHELPGRNLIGVIDGASTVDEHRPVYLMTRDNMLEGDSGASGLARRLERSINPPAPLRIQVPAHVASNFRASCWEMYDLTADPIESTNLWTDAKLDMLRAHLQSQSKSERARSIPERNRPWPYATRRTNAPGPTKSPSLSARLLRRAVQALGIHGRRGRSRRSAVAPIVGCGWSRSPRA